VNWSYLFFSFDGRIPRQTFWSAFLVILGIEIACRYVVNQFADDQRLEAVVALLFTYSEFALFAKRGHDRNISPRVIGVFFVLDVFLGFLIVVGLGGTREQPGIFMLVVLLAWFAFAIVLLVELGLRRGTRGPNRYGPDPLV